MTNKNSVWCTIMGILGYIIGIGYCFTLIFIPVAIYCFIGAKKYIEWANLTDSQLAQYKSNLTNWAVFFSIVGCPIGLLSIVPAVLVSNNPTITTVSEPETKAEEENKQTQTTDSSKEEKATVENTLETIQKLESLLKEGLITNEEFERAKTDVLNKK